MSDERVSTERRIIRSFIRDLRALGVIEYEGSLGSVGMVRLKLAPSAPTADERPMPPAEGMPSDEEMLFASSPFPVTDEEKKAQ